MHLNHQMTRRSFMGLTGSAAAVTGLNLAGCGSDSGSSEGSGGSAGSSEQIGGSLTIYTPNSETLTNTVIPAFEDKTGITVDLIQAGTGEVFKKLESEKDNPVADIVWGGGYTKYWSSSDLFQEYTAAENDNVIESYRNTTGYSTPYCLDGSVILLNKDLTDGMDIKGYADLLRDDLSGKIASADPANSSSAFAQLTNMLKDMGGYDSDDAWDYVRKLYTLVAGKIASSSSNVYKTVSDGEMSVGLSYEDPCVQLLIDGANVDVVYPKEGCVFLPASSAIIKNCQNLDQAKAWIDYTVSQEGQQVIAENTTVRPVRDDVTLNSNMKPMDEINVVEEDYEYVSQHADEIVSKYTDISTSIAG